MFWKEKSLSKTCAPRKIDEPRRNLQTHLESLVADNIHSEAMDGELDLDNLLDNDANVDGDDVLTEQLQ